jgi:AraC-like DNA-binding protein
MANHRPAHAYTSTNPPRRLSDEDVRAIRIHRKQGTSLQKIAAMFHTSEHTVARVCNYELRFALIK